ncbi:hypothetical protein PC120_g10029 [Phytophthora cactorum]|nr:hypothetical protein PC120_g10029 [Phytophthora cactorum]
MATVSPTSPLAKNVDTCSRRVMAHWQAARALGRSCSSFGVREDEGSAAISFTTPLNAASFTG